jgi:hypothetical protein
VCAAGGFLAGDCCSFSSKAPSFLSLIFKVYFFVEASDGPEDNAFFFASMLAVEEVVIMSLSGIENVFVYLRLSFFEDDNEDTVVSSQFVFVCFPNDSGFDDDMALFPFLFSPHLFVDCGRTAVFVVVFLVGGSIYTSIALDWPVPGSVPEVDGLLKVSGNFLFILLLFSIGCGPSMTTGSATIDPSTSPFASYDDDVVASNLMDRGITSFQVSCDCCAFATCSIMSIIS